MMDDVTQQNAALVEEASAAAQALTEQASNLNELIARYRVGDSTAKETPRVAPQAARPAAAPVLERRAANRPMTGKKPAAAPVKAQARTAASGSDEQWKDF